MNDSNRACVLLLDLPEAAFCGIDLLSFTSGPRFRGIKQLPTGWHFVFVGATNSFSLRYGVWFHVGDAQQGPPEVYVKQWNKQNEELLSIDDETELQKWRANLGAIWRECLTPYRQTATDAVKNEAEVVEEKQDWPKMTDCITPELLSRITGIETKNHWALTSASSAEIDYDDIPGLSQAESVLHPEKSLVFSPVDLKQTWATGTVGRARTDAARDRSWALEQVVTTHCRDAHEIIGELQFCFLMVLTLNNNSCLEQWRRLLNLVLTCSQAVVERGAFFTKFLSSLRVQLEHCQDAEGGLFDLSDEGGGLIHALLQRFKAGIERQSSSINQDVWDEVEELEDILMTQRGWAPNESQARKGMLELEDGEQVEMDTSRFDEEDETGEYAPMVVELTPQQLRELTGENEESIGTGIKHMQLASEAYNPNDYEEDDRDVEELDARY